MAKKSEPRYLIIPIDQIELLDDNPREISSRDFKKLCNDIKKDPDFLIQRPPLVNHITAEKRMIAYAGNQRLKAAKENGMKDIGVWIQDDVPKELQDERMLKDNLHRGQWDFEKLVNFDASLLLDSGFRPDELNSIFNDILTINDDEFDVEFDVEKAVNEIGTPQTKPGDIYILGEHVLMCGDSTNPEDVRKLMDGHKAKVIYCDPPYNIGYDYTKGASSTKNNYTDTKVEDSRSASDYQLFISKTIANALENAEPDVHVFYWCDQTYTDIIMAAFRENGIQVRRMCLWIKNNFTPVPQTAFNKGYEPCIYGTKGKPELNKELKNLSEILNQEIGSSNTLDDLQSYLQIWLNKRDYQNNYEHPTQKPVTLHEKPLKRCSGPGDIIIDLFGGSGSTLVAADQLKRKARLMEQQPVFCDVIVKRWERLTGFIAGKVQHTENQLL